MSEPLLAIIAGMPVPVQPADEQLMHAYASGDARAFETLYDRHATRLWRYVFKSVGDSASTDELTQEVWFSVARQAGIYRPTAASADRPPAQFSTWLFTLARHRVIDQLRARRLHVSLDGEPDGSPALAETLAAPSDFGPLSRVETRQQAEQLVAALDALPAEQREAFLLQAEGGMEVAEIAAVTGVGPETAKSRLRYARAALRRTLGNMA